ncbi:hypothetical protein ACROYT_G033512 [Oculina patagonica]
MKVAFFVFFAFFCSLWTIGSFLQRWECVSSSLYEDCQNKSAMVNCTRFNSACFQAELMFEKGSVKTLHFQKGCVNKDNCQRYERGDIDLCNTQKLKGYTVDCQAKCCHEDECNKGNLLVENKGKEACVTQLRSLFFSFQFVSHLVGEKRG